jgi:putative lipoprotein (rSAM/lipoprotein system)
MKTKIRVAINALLTMVLGGTLTACFAVEYGVPYVTADVEGRVTNEQNEPLQKMQVVVKTVEKWYGNTAYTNMEGEFDVEDYILIGSSQPEEKLQVIVNDTNNVYLSDTIEVAFSDMKRKKVDEWETNYSTKVNIQLKKK